MTHTEESPLQLRRLHDTATEEYRFTEQLLTAAFPPEEYRDFEELRVLTQDDPRFRNHAILDRGEPVGVLSYWDFGRFHYVEHFAVCPGMRNRGYGRKVLGMLRSRLHTPVVLEVERPDSELAARRIAFYRRNGFTLWESDYVQPPYRPGGDAPHGLRRIVRSGRFRLGGGDDTPRGIRLPAGHPGIAGRTGASDAGAAWRRGPLRRTTAPKTPHCTADSSANFS